MSLSREQVAILEIIRWSTELEWELLSNQIGYSAGATSAFNFTYLVSDCIIYCKFVMFLYLIGYDILYYLYMSSNMTTKNIQKSKCYNKAK